MDNNLKLLMNEQDLHNLKNTSIALKKYLKDILEPLKNTLANEARRAINYNRKVETTIREGERVIAQIRLVLGEKEPSQPVGQKNPS